MFCWSSWHACHVPGKARSAEPAAVTYSGGKHPLSLLTWAGLSLQVYLCARSWQNPAWATETVPFGHKHNIWRRPVPTRLAKDGSVTFSDGQRVEKVDTVMYCTGYLYTFPFLENIVSTADNRYCCCTVLPALECCSVCLCLLMQLTGCCTCLSVWLCARVCLSVCRSLQDGQAVAVLRAAPKVLYLTPSQAHTIITTITIPSLHTIITPWLHTITAHHHYIPSLHTQSKV